MNIGFEIKYAFAPGSVLFYTSGVACVGLNGIDVISINLNQQSNMMTPTVFIDYHTAGWYL